MRYNKEWFKRRMETVFSPNNKNGRNFSDRFTDEYNVLMIKIHNEKLKEVTGRNGLYIRPEQSEHTAVTYDSIDRALKTINLYIKRYKVKQPIIVISVAENLPPALTLTDKHDNKYITVFIAPSYIHPTTDYIYDKEDEE